MASQISRKPKRTETDTELGEVEIFDNEWSAKVDMPSLGKVEIQGVGSDGVPSEEEKESVKRIDKEWKSLLEKSYEALEASLDKPGLDRSKLKLSTICVSGEPGSFTVFFGVSNAQEKLGELYATFYDFEVVAADSER